MLRKGYKTTESIGGDWEPSAWRFLIGGVSPVSDWLDCQAKRHLPLPAGLQNRRQLPVGDPGTVSPCVESLAMHGRDMGPPPSGLS